MVSQMVALSDNPPAQHERTLVLVKAVPRPSKTYQETVCCAGITENGEWRRIFPVRFRHLTGNQQFRRWQWLGYRWRSPRDDRRVESRRIEEDSIVPGKILPVQERVRFLESVLRKSSAEAEACGESLALIEPRTIRVRIRAKSAAAIEAEKTRYREAARQQSLIDAALVEIEPCPYAVQIPFVDQDGRQHAPLCEDWETSAAFFNLRRRMSDQAVIQHLEHAYTDRSDGRRIFLALGTVKRRPKQWLLLGIIRLRPAATDVSGQAELDL